MFTWWPVAIQVGLKVNPDRPNKKLPYRGAWLWIGSEMIHLMELPNPDPLEDRPEHGGRDRHFCLGIEDLDPLIEALDRANVEYTKSMSGRPAVFFRDPGTGVGQLYCFCDKCLYTSISSVVPNALVPLLSGDCQMLCRYRFPDK